ncbi:GFA family protein [Pseudogemmobacter sonorensis]|uniref:GFA family protein n=1 Tax=Pseudogemmobacter sonorensis TaxID=2989681 RepID=UPI00367A9DDD
MAPESPEPGASGHGGPEHGAKEERVGQCLCGAVRFTARLGSLDYGTCHCVMCRRWTGSALLAITVPLADVTWSGTEHIGEIQSSAWAMRAFCAKCGSGLYYKLTDGPWADAYEIPIGLFDDADGMVMKTEIYHDQKPDAFSYAGSAKKMSRAETLVFLGLDASPSSKE